MLKKGMPQDLEELVQFMELQESAEKSSTAKVKAQGSEQQCQPEQQSRWWQQAQG
jgi:hypothetical protein